MAGDGGTRAVVAALLANLGIAVTKFVAFALTGASSMLAEAIHSVADSGNQVLLLVGGKRVAARGRRRSTRSASAASATSTRSSSPIVLFSVGGLFALYEAYHKCARDPRGSPDELLDGPVVVGPDRRAGRRDRAGELLASAPRSSSPTRSAATRRWRAVHPPRQGARAAGDPARGLRRADRPGLRPVRRRADADHRQRLLGRRRHGGDRHSCSSRSRSSSPSRPRACCSVSPPAREAPAPDRGRARPAPRASSGSST